MSIHLRADNRELTKDAKASYLVDNYPSATSMLYIMNTEGFFHNSSIIVGNIGSENTEMLKVDTVDRNTGALTFSNFADFSLYSANAAATITIAFTTNKTFVTRQPVTIQIQDTGVTRAVGFINTSGTGTSILVDSIGGALISVAAGDQVVVSDITKFAHAESTRVIVSAYNKIRFFRTETPQVPNAVAQTTREDQQNGIITEAKVSTLGADPTTTVYTKSTDPSFVQTVDYTPAIIFQGAKTLSPLLDIQVNDFQTTFDDDINFDGYAWYAFFNENSGRYSPVSNYIPYAGFAENSVIELFNAFNSELNTKDIKLITQSDRFTWLNDAVIILTNALNLGNWEYMASENLVLSLKQGISQYLLPNNFSNMLWINDSKGGKIEHYSASFQRESANSYMKYLIRGKYIVFDPAPTEDAAVTMSYLAKASRITRLDQTVDLPDNCHIYTRNYMLSRAYAKLSNTAEANRRLTMFNEDINTMKISGFKRDNGLDSFTPSPTSII